LQGGPTGHGPNKNELLLRKAQGLSDLAKLVTDVANYTSGSFFTNCPPHLEGKEVFGFAKQLVNCVLSIHKDSHHFDHMNFFCPQVSVMAIKPNIMEDVHFQQLPPASSMICYLCYLKVA
jgi:hypothetical protein